MAQKQPNSIDFAVGRPGVMPPAPPKKEHPSRPGRKCDCLNWCGDDPALHDGRADPCDHRIKIEQAAAERALWRLCHWKDVNKELPDADETVLVATIDNTEPVWLGYYDGERWLDVEGIPVKVAHWAPMPEAPKC